MWGFTKGRSPFRGAPGIPLKSYSGSAGEGLRDFLSLLFHFTAVKTEACLFGHLFNTFFFLTQTLRVKHCTRY